MEDKKLKELIRENAYVKAPDTMKEDIMAKIAMASEQKVSHLAYRSPGRKMLYFILALFLILILWSLLSGSASSAEWGGLLDQYKPTVNLQIPSFEFSTLLDQKIIMWASIALLLFVGIEVIKNRSLILKHSI